MRIIRVPHVIVLIGVACLVWAPAASAVDPNPLENAYWRFEEGVAGNPVDPPQVDVVLDSINENHMRTFADGDPVDSRPRYTADVPVSIIPQTGESNTLALHFTPNQDIWAEAKNIDNPIIENGFTLEAAFKPETVAAFQVVVGKDGKPNATMNEQTLALKVRGDTGELQIELFDGSNTIHGVRSLAPLVPNQWYYAAVTNDGTNLSLYLDRNDGAGYVLQGTDPTPLVGALWEGENPGEPGGGFYSVWAIGRGMFAGNVTDWFNGVIDEVRLSNTVLAPEQFLFFEGLNPADFDQDGDVDGDDFHLLDACTTGPEVPYDPLNLPAGCVQTPDQEGLIRVDMDGDGDVDSKDFGLYQVEIGL